MDALNRARRDLESLQDQQQELEESIIEVLQAKGTEGTQEVVQLEQHIAELKVAMDEQQALIDYYVNRVEDAIVAAQTEVFVLAYQSTRVHQEGGTIEEENATLSRRVLRWSEANQHRRVTSLLVATNSSFFGVLEGNDKAEVEKTYALLAKASSWHKDCTVIFTQYAAAREHTVGVVLRYIEDDLLGFFVDAIRQRGLGATHYASQEALRVLRTGGDPSVLIPETNQKIVLTVALDGKCGAMHTAESYDKAALLIDSLAQEYGADVVDRFGEYMTLLFPVQGMNPATAACSCARRIYDSVEYAIIAAHTGTVTAINTEWCSAHGPGIRDCMKLVRLAETQRRPMLITPAVYDRANKAVHPFTTFTLDSVRYYALRVVGEHRLPVPQEPLMKEHIDSSWLDPVHPDRTNTLPPYSGSAGAEEEDEAAAAAKNQGPLVKGALTGAELKSMFRQLDPGNVGWIGKAKFRSAIEKSDKFPVFAHDLARVDRWLSTYNRLGKERLSFEEFAILCLKFEQQ